MDKNLVRNPPRIPADTRYVESYRAMEARRHPARFLAQNVGFTEKPGNKGCGSAGRP